MMQANCVKTTLFKILGICQQRTVVLQDRTEVGGAPQLPQLTPVRDPEGETPVELGELPDCGYERGVHGQDDGWGCRQTDSEVRDTQQKPTDLRKVSLENSASQWQIFGIQSKITRHTKKNGKVESTESSIEKKNQSTEIDPELTQILKLTERGITINDNCILDIFFE